MAAPAGLREDAAMTEQSPQQPADAPVPGVVVVGPTEQQPAEQQSTESVASPAKVMRIGAMIKQLLEEVRNAPLDDAGRARLADVHERSLSELKDGLAPELVEELERLSLPFTSEFMGDAQGREG